MQQLLAGFGLERAPELRSALRHSDVSGVGVAQPEDTGRPVRPTAQVSDRFPLEHQHVAPTAQRPRGRESEEPAADDHDVCVRDPTHAESR